MSVLLFLYHQGPRWSKTGPYSGPPPSWARRTPWCASRSLVSGTASSSPRAPKSRPSTNNTTATARRPWPHPSLWTDWRWTAPLWVPSPLWIWVPALCPHPHARGTLATPLLWLHRSSTPWPHPEHHPCVGETNSRPQELRRRPAASWSTYCRASQHSTAASRMSFSWGIASMTYSRQSK